MGSIPLQSQKYINKDWKLQDLIRPLSDGCLLHEEQSLRMTLKNAVFWDVTQCGSYKNRRFGGSYRLHHQGEKNQRARNNVSCN
jgi:hypothetical protein